MANELPQITKIDFLRERNSEQLASTPIFPAPVVKGPEDLKEIAAISSVPNFHSLISGVLSFQRLPTEIYNPALLGSTIKALQAHSAIFDQEASTVIAKKDGHLYILNQIEQNGIFAEYQNGYSTGTITEVRNADVLTQVHSHPIGTLAVDEQAGWGLTLDPRRAMFYGNIPSVADLTFLLQRKEGNHECPSIIVVGPQIAMLIARTNETPQYRELNNRTKYDVWDELENLRTKDGGSDFEKSMKQYFAILKKFNLAMYVMPLGEKDPLFLWNRMYPNPENVQ